MRTNILYSSFTAMALAVVLASCGGGNDDYDATGTFETTEVVVSAEQTGKLLRFDIDEGNHVGAGDEVGIIDTVQLYLKACQIGATKLAYSTQRPETQKQIAAMREQIAKAQQDVSRYEQLVSDGAANRKLLDDARSQLHVLESQLTAQLSTLKNSTNSLNAQMSVADAQKLEVIDNLQKCHVLSPISGVVLEKYAEPGEFAATGKPLFKVADIDNMFLRAYLTSLQLKDVKLGQQVTVYADFGDGERREYGGQVTWISSKSEFTPKTILTDDERADLVYAVKVAVKNDGYIKIGMYGEVRF